MSEYSKERWQRLAGILKEQVDMVADMNAPIVSREPELAPIKLHVEPVAQLDEKELTEDTKNLLAGYVSYLRAIHLWFHAAHHLTKGSGFAGDHVSLYGKIYTEVQDEIDGAVEKAIGLTNDENLGCPLMMATNAVKIMEEAGCQVDADPVKIAETGLKLEKEYLEFLEDMFVCLEGMGSLSLGLNDQLAASANTHETYVYLLQQRVKAC